MSFTAADATKLAKERAPFSLSKSAFHVFLKILAGTHRKTPVPDISQLLMKTRIATLMKWAGVTSVRQGDRIVAELVAYGLVQVIQRQYGELRYKVDPDKLLGFPKSADVLKDRITRRNADRASAARAQRAENRLAQRERDAERFLPEEWW